MDDRSQGAAGPSQRESVETSGSTIEIDNHDIGSHEEADLKSALDNRCFNCIDEILDANPTLAHRTWIEPYAETPLHYSCGLAWDDVTEYLLRRADIVESFDKVDGRGFIPLQRALRGRCSSENILSMIDRSTPFVLESKTKEKDTLIHLASRSKRVDVLDRLCTLLPSMIDATNEFRSTAIHEGVESWEVVSCLRRRGASEIRSDNGDTLLHAVVAPAIVSRHGGRKTRWALLKEGVDLGTPNRKGNTPLHLVASMVNSTYDDTGMFSAILRELLGLSEAPYNDQTRSSLISIIDKKNKAEDTLLHLIASKEIDGDASLRLSKQTRVNDAVQAIASLCPNVLISADKENNTPLHRACLVKNWFLVKTLLEAGDENGLRPYEIVKKPNKQGDIPLHVAVREGDLGAVTRLITGYQCDGTVLIRNKEEETSLHVAAAQGRPEILKELFERWLPYGKVVFADQGRALRDKKNMTPLHIAADETIEDKATSMVDQILDGCTDPKHLNEVVPENGWSPLHFAARRGHERIVELLLLNGADSRMTDNVNLDAVDIAYRHNHIEISGFIRTYRSRSFRLELEPLEGNKNVDNHFLALSWPKWDKAVRQQRDGLPRVSPQVTPVHQLIFDDNDTYYGARHIGPSMDHPQRLTHQYIPRPLHERDEVAEIRIMPKAIALAPIHQAQIRIVSCVRKGWMIEERRDFEKGHVLEKMKDSQRQNKNRANLTHVYHAEVFQDKKRLTRWIHFPANNRAWIEDLCRCMYSHGSLTSELIGMLRFIDDYFGEVEGSQNYRYRKPGFIAQLLEKTTDPNPSRSRSGNRSGDEKKLEGQYSAYSLVFPLLDMDFIHPGFCYRSVQGIKKRSITRFHRSPTSANLPQEGRMSPSSPGSAKSTNADQTRVQTHWKNMEALKERATVHLSRALDHYCHQRIPSEELQRRVEGQVLTRFMKRQGSGGNTSLTRKEPGPRKTLTRCSEVFSKLLRSISKSRDSHQLTSSMEKGLQGAKGAVDADGKTVFVEDIATNTNDTQPPREILVVPQLWLWKFDNLVITSFPERWDCNYKRNSLVDNILERVEYLDVNGGVHPNTLITEILDACAEFQPTLKVGDQDFTWTDAFDDEILSVSRKIKNCYERFEGDLGMSDARFSEAFVTPTECLRIIDDVLDELTCIKRVFQDQLLVWNKVHSGDKSCVVCDTFISNQDTKGDMETTGDVRGRGNVETRGKVEEQSEDASGDKEASEVKEQNEREQKHKGAQDRDTCPSNVLPERSLELTKRLEEDALKVRESVVTLLTLLQGEASTENSLRASEQSKILAVFTVVTVIFAPLSWVTSLFAVEVQGFPSTWTMKDINLGSFFTIMVTVVICASSWPLWKLFDRNLFNRKRMDHKEEGAECHLCEGPQNVKTLNP